MTWCLDEGLFSQSAGDYMAVFYVSFVSSVGHLQLRIVVVYTILSPSLVILGFFLGGRGGFGGLGHRPPQRKASEWSGRIDFKFSMTMESLILHNNLSHEPLTVASSDGCLTLPRKLGNAQEKAFEGGGGGARAPGIPLFERPSPGPSWASLGKGDGSPKMFLAIFKTAFLISLFFGFS